jgi:hypothetical protein
LQALRTLRRVLDVSLSGITRGSAGHNPHATGLIGWAFDRTIDASLVLEAWQRALTGRRSAPQPRHSDCGAIRPLFKGIAAARSHLQQSSILRGTFVFLSRTVVTFVV